MRIERQGGYLEYREGMKGSCELFDIEVTEKRKGLGTEMVKELMAKYDCIYAFMIEKNHRAHKFYRSLGFERVAKLPDFYPHYEDANHRNAVMWLWVR